jgi:hypothetical protein
VVEHLDPRGRRVWRCSIFRNESPARASDLIRSATTLTGAYWASKFGVPSVPLTTEVAPSKVRPKVDPGHCFVIAGWRVVRRVPAGHGRPGHIVLVAPQFHPQHHEEHA